LCAARDPLTLRTNTWTRLGNHRARRRRSYQQARAKISRQARLSFPPARRSPRHLQNRTAKSQLDGLKRRITYSLSILRAEPALAPRWLRVLPGPAKPRRRHLIPRRRHLTTL